MTAANRAIEIGCESLTQVANVSGVPRRTLYDYYKNKLFVFDAICFHVVRAEAQSFKVQLKWTDAETEKYLKKCQEVASEK